MSGAVALEAGEAQKGGPTLDEVLYSLRTSPLRREDLERFMASEFNEEQIKFWTAAEEYRQRFEGALAPSIVRSEEEAFSDGEMAKEFIVGEFVKAGSPKEINVSAGTRGTTLEKAERGDKGVFDDAQRAVKNLINDDPFGRFLSKVSKMNLAPTESNKRIYRGAAFVLLGIIVVCTWIGIEASQVIPSDSPFLSLVRLLVWPFLNAGLGDIFSGRQKL